MKVRLGILLASALLVLAPLDAQRATSLSGKWAVAAEAAVVDTSDGERWNLVAISGTLQLEQKEASVAGSWQGRMPTPWKLTGSIDGSAFELQSEIREMPVTRNGEPGTAPRRWIFTGTIDGDTLKGSMALSSGETTPPSQPFTAKRAN